METWQALIVALVQGLTEFLPVSSSGHMVLVERLMGVDTSGATWEVAFHFGTLLAVFFIFWREIWNTCAGFLTGIFRMLGGTKPATVWAEVSGFRMGMYIIIGTIPAALIGLTLEDQIESAFGNPFFALLCLFITGEILWLSRPHGLLRRKGKLRLPDAVVIGIAQSFALLPGISRSGTTITTGLMRGVERDVAARFSFLLSVPAILGACVLKYKDVLALPREQLPAMGLGVAMAAISGTIALLILLRIVKAGKLHLFAFYCWAVAVIGAVYLWGTHQPPAF